MGFVARGNFFPHLILDLAPVLGGFSYPTYPSLSPRCLKE